MAFGLQRFDIAAVTRRLVLEEISVDPQKPITLIVGHAGESNKRWDSWQFKRRNELGAVARGKELTQERRALDRADAAVTLANTVVLGWENVVEDGHLVDYTVEAGTRFLNELIEHCPDVWQRIVSFVIDSSNFRSPSVDPADLGKG
ncbi:MAG TPA: hypothetical protein VFT22_07360 [Kofleriaceae bacterium]|nr:hypothetical protein [Kofleriaceae bacterium]